MPTGDYDRYSRNSKGDVVVPWSNEPAMSTKQVADKLKVSVNTVCKWISGGKLKAWRCFGNGPYYILVTDLETFLQDHHHGQLVKENK